MKRITLALGLLCLWLSATAFLAEPSGRPIADSPEEITPPRPIESCRVLPIYPEAELRAGVEGTVLLSTEVKSDGKVGTIEVKQGVEGHLAFSDAAMAAVQQWCFEPARKNGEATPLTIVIPVRFQLETKVKSTGTED
jgi:protein TonB